LIEESKNLNEYAFALGALRTTADTRSRACHQPSSCNDVSRPGKKYGPVVTYQEKPSAHMKVEYGFDVDQVAEGNSRPRLP
jgi:hypothetical protein